MPTPCACTHAPARTWPTAGGSLHTLTAGVNWYWQKKFKFALDYVKVASDRRGVSDDPSILEARMQLHW